MTDHEIRQEAPLLMPYQWEPFNGDTFIEQKFLEFRDRFGIKTIIETGSCFATSAIWMAKNFNFVITFENTSKYYDIAVKRISVAGVINMHCRLLDSVIGLNEILPKCKNDKLMFFLDAHFYGNCPLLDELKVIADNNLRPVIAIHDFKVPGRQELGFDTYGEIVYEWAYIKDSIEAIYGKDGFEVEYNEKAVGAKRGIIYCYPK